MQSSPADDPAPVWVPPPVARLGPPSPSEPPPLPRTLPEVPAARARVDWRLVRGVALFAAACVAVSYSEWRSVDGLAPPTPTANAAPAAAESSATSEPATDASGPWPDPLVSLYETHADSARPIKLKYRVIDPRRAASRARPARPPRATTVAAAMPAPQPTSRWPSRPATLPPGLATVSPPRLAAAPVPPRATPAPSVVEARLPAAEPRPTPAASVPSHTEALPGEEERIRSTLARFRSAYSQLDARAARAVWPTVDMRALERAFDGLKSQELRFDRCSLAVEGVRARAACTGRAVYVPRIGSQSPRSTSREWTFELTKADEGWTIASARSS